jgi:hypothetical protein
MSVPALRAERPLAELVAVVDRNLEAFVEVGLALCEIRDRRLYKETHGTFEAFCQERWDMSRQRGYQLIDASKVAEVLSTMVDIPNERQARELAPLLPDEAAVVEVYRDAKEEHGDATPPAKTIGRLAKNYAKKKEREKAAALRAAEPVEILERDDIRFELGDFRDLLPTVKCDAIITDPPYERDFVESGALADLSDIASDQLNDGGLLVVMMGQSYLPDVFEQLGTALEYRWTCNYRTPGRSTRVRGRSANTVWKPLLVFHKRDDEQAAKRYITLDEFTSERPDKQHHEWGQSVSGTTRMVEAFSEPGDLVVDPFLGGGTTAIACRATGRRFWGCDTDADAVNETERRLQEAEVTS